MVFYVMFKVYRVSSFLLWLLLLAQAHGNDKIGFYQLKRGNLHLNLTNYGASVISVFVPDKHGVFYITSYVLQLFNLKSHE